MVGGRAVLSEVVEAERCGRIDDARATTISEASLYDGESTQIRGERDA